MVRSPAVRPAVRIPLGRLVFLSLVLLTSASAASRSPDSERGRPPVQVYLPRDYKDDNQVWCAAQHPDGLMFFGGLEKALFFDGVRWEKISIPARNVRALAPAPDGRIYVGGIDAIGFLERNDQGHWTYHSLNYALPESHRAPGTLRGVFVHRDGVYFVTGRAVHRWQDGHMRTWDLGGNVWQWGEQLDGEFYLLRQGRGLLRLHDDDFQLVSDAPEIAASPRLVLFRLPDGALAQVLSDGRIVRVSLHETSPVPTEADRLLQAGGVNIGRRLRDGTLVLATDHSGVVHLSPEGPVLGFVDTSLGLDNQSVLNVGQDLEGNVWLCTNSGVARVEFGRPYTLFDRLNGLGRDVISDMARFRGDMWAGAWDGLYRLHPASGDRPAHFVRHPDVDAQVWAVKPFHDFLLVGTNRGVLSLDVQERIQPVLPTADDVLTLQVSRRDPNLVYLGRATGVSALRFESGQWRDLGRIADLDTNVRSIEEDRVTGDIWLGTRDRGIFRLRWSDDSTGGILDQPPSASEESLTHGFGIVMVLHGELFFQTPSGRLHRFDPARQQFVPEPKWQGSGPGSAPGWFAEGPGDSFWAWEVSQEFGQEAGLNNLLGRYVRDDSGWTWQPFSRRVANLLGQAQLLVYEPDAVDPDRGTLWVNGVDGMMRFEVGTPLDSAPSFRAVIRHVRGPDGFDVFPRPDTPLLQFAPMRDRLHFEFAAPTFLHGNDVRFRTRLLGFDDRWSDWQDEAALSFTRLEGGPFTFEVQAEDREGRISEPARISFSVAPPWQRSPTAYAFYALAGLGLVSGYIRWRLRRSERERRRLEQLVAQRTAQLEAANKAKSVFLANMSHELRTPLNGVIGYAQVLQKSPDIAPRDRERLRIVQTSGEHLLRMINEVLDFSKIEAGKLELRPALFHLPQLLRDIASALEPRAAQKNLTFTLHAAPDLPTTVIGDAQKLRQVLDNLLGNAVKFTPAGQIALHVTRAVSSSSGLSALSSQLHFSVHDTGVGISAADQRALFQPFHQPVDGRPPEPGTGLGLAIAKRLVELMGGKLEVESAPGSGSPFSFSIPFEIVPTDAVPSEPAARAPVGYHGERRRLLVVDDVPTNRSVLVELLAPLGFEIREAASGLEALELMPTFAPHLVFLDLRMPGMDGFELAAHLRALPSTTPRPKLIAMSASVLSFNRDKALEAGCDDFLPKPFRESDLTAKLARHLRLEWNYGDAAHPCATQDSAASVSADELRTLLDIARRGEIRPLREHLAALHQRHPTDPRLQELESLARHYQMEQLRARLSAHLRASDLIA